MPREPHRGGRPGPGRHTEFSAGDRFRFNCHAGLECFNRCCRDINIFLSPYDVLRLSRKLGLTTGEFLERYTIRLQRPGGFPVVLIKMREEAGLQCPFVTASGCSVYDQRPWSCRMAPVEIRGDNRYGFAFDSDFCRGLLEDKEWTVAGWMKNQGNDIYEELEQGFNEIPGKLSFTGFSALDEHIREVFYIACYDLDCFRQLVFDGDFIQVFGVAPETVEIIHRDDVALLQFGFKWLAEGFDLRRSIDVWNKVFG